MAQRKVKDGEKSPCRQCLTRPVPNGRRRSGFWSVPENFCVFLPNQKAKRRRPFGTGLVRHCPQGLFPPFFAFLLAIFSRPFRLSLAPTICPWVSKDALHSGYSVTYFSQTSNRFDIPRKRDSPVSLYSKITCGLLSVKIHKTQYSRATHEPRPIYPRDTAILKQKRQFVTHISTHTYLADFLKTNPGKFAAIHLSGKRPKGNFFAPDKLNNHTIKGKGKNKQIDCRTHSSYIFYFGDSLLAKKCLAKEV